MNHYEIDAALKKCRELRRLHPKRDFRTRDTSKGDYIMGAIFIYGQGSEYLNLIDEGMTIPSGPFGTVFYLATGFHGLHVIGGLIAFVYLLIRTKLSKFSPAQATSTTNSTHT